MSYDQIGLEIESLKSQFQQRKERFGDAKSSISDLETLMTTFEEKNIKHDKKQYKKAISAFESGDYESAQTLANDTREKTEDSISKMEMVNIRKEQLLKKVDDSNLLQDPFPATAIKEADKLIANGDFQNRRG